MAVYTQNYLWTLEILTQQAHSLMVKAAVARGYEDPDVLSEMPMATKIATTSRHRRGWRDAGALTTLT